jgi:hypothetical protein
MAQIFALLAAAVGALSGWCVSLTPLGGWIKHVLGNPDFTLAELGALLGFVGAFFRSSVTKPSKKD